MTEMIERVARAILHRRGFEFYSDPMEGGQDAYDISLEAIEEGRAALEAMREPTEAMISAAWPLASEAERRRCVEDYQDMIGAAIEDGA